MNRALEGLAIDVFNTMRDFGDAVADPVLYFCEDWMLADEVTHVKMGSRLAAPHHRQRPRAAASAALDFQRTVDKLFSFGGFRGEEEENPIHLARKFRALAGFTDDEITDLVDAAAEAYAEAQAQWPNAGRPPLSPSGLTRPVPRSSCSTSTRVGHGSSSSATGSPALWALGANWLAVRCARAPCGGSPWSSRWRSSCRSRSASRWSAGQKSRPPQFHMFYGFVAIIAVGDHLRVPRPRCAAACYLLYGFGGLFLMGLGIRAMLVGRTVS